MTNGEPNGCTSRRFASISIHVRQHRKEATLDRAVMNSASTYDDRDTHWADTLDRLRAFVAARVEDREVAADITQDVIVRSIASGALERVDNPVAWLYRAARNAVIDHYRTRHRHDALDDDHWPDPDAPDGEPNDATRELSRCLQPLLHRLTPAARDALERVDVAGETHHRAADTLGISVSGMKSRVQLARRELKELLEQCCIVELDSIGAVADYRPNSSNTCSCAAARSS